MANKNSFQLLAASQNLDPAANRKPYTGSQRCHGWVLFCFQKAQAN